MDKGDSKTPTTQKKLDGAADAECDPPTALQAKRERNKRRHERNKQWRAYLQSLNSSLRASDSFAIDIAEGDSRNGCRTRQPNTMRNAKESRRKKPALPAELRCTFYLAQKRRNCSRARLEGTGFCLTHQGQSQPAGALAECRPSTSPVGSQEELARCEACGSTMRQSKLSKHAARCNATKHQKDQQALSCWVAGFNSGPTSPTSPANQLPADSVRELQRRVEAAFTKYCMGKENAIQDAVMVASGPDALQEVAVARGSAATDTVVQKHLSQQSSIIGHMQACGLLRCADSPRTATASRPTYVEFGAGKGMLSLGISGQDPAADLLLVEREGGVMRTKADKLLRARAGRGRFERICIDIRDLDISRYVYGERRQEDTTVAANESPTGDKQCQRFGRPVIAVSKHLCGVATDLALRCLVNYQQSVTHTVAAAGEGSITDAANAWQCQPCKDDTSSALSDAPVVQGIAIALCCHGLCNWRDYVGQHFWTHILGFSELDFERMKRFGSWATGARKKVQEQQSAHNLAQSNQCQGQDESLLEPSEMVDFGRKCKRLIDAGRRYYIRQHFPHLRGSTRLLSYCQESVSPENCLLLASTSQSFQLAESSRFSSS